MANILIVDDDLSLREVLEIALLKKGHTVWTAPDSATALSLTYELVRSGELDFTDIPRLWCWRTAETFGLPANRMQPGDPADFVLFDPDLAWVASAEALLSKGKNTPCLDKEVPGRVMAHYLGGEEVFSR